MAKVTILDHPLIQHKLTIIRDKNTGTKSFREVVDEIARLMAYEITRDMPLEDVEIETSEDFILFLLGTLRGREKSAKYQVEFGEGNTDREGYSLPQKGER